MERRRLDKKTDPSAVVISGGHIEDGEIHVDDLKRELLEELGVTCTSFRFIARMPCEAETGIQMNHWYLCNDRKGEPISTEVEEIFSSLILVNWIYTTIVRS